jgi:2-polyprenyl-3-methyl-5-hydroxy-6-metoxy-1,4-benzoquinol methylase
MSSVERNRDYYEALPPGRDDYWRYMAAPRHRAARLKRLLARIAPSSVVDLGCGNGQLLSELYAKWPRIKLAGVDLSAPRIEANRTAMPHIEWICADLQQPIANAHEARSQAFDVVIASEIIEHLDAPALLLSHARSLAGPDGHLILTTQSGPVRETERRVGHVRHFTRDELSDLLESTGWTALRVWNEGFPFHDLSKWWANRNPSRSIGRFGSDAYGFSQRFVCLALRAAFLFNSRRRGAQLFALARRRP